MTRNSLTHTLPKAIYHCPPGHWPAWAESFRKHHVQVLESPLKGNDLAHALRCLAGDLRFPEWFGDNLDALHDVLTDPAWHQNHPQAILLKRADGAEALAGDDLDSLLEVLDSAAAIRREEGVPLWILSDFAVADVAQIPDA